MPAATIDRPGLETSGAQPHREPVRRGPPWRALLAAAAVSLRDAAGAGDRLRLLRYFAGRGAARCGLSGAGDTELVIRLGRFDLTFRPAQGELYLYKEIFADRVYERHPAFLPRPGWTVVDLGANIGLYTLRAAAAGPPGRILALEPRPDTFRRLVRNLAANGLLGLATPLELAAGAVGGTAAFDPGPASPLGRLRSESPERGSGPARLRVRVTTLAELAARERLDRIHLLKIDVEGAEAEVLAGAAAALGRVERVVIEFHGRRVAAEADRRLRDAGFRCVLQAPPAYGYYLGEGVPS